jgi:hypothetical protein
MDMGGRAPMQKPNEYTRLDPGKIALVIGELQTAQDLHQSVNLASDGGPTRFAIEVEAQAFQKQILLPRRTLQLAAGRASRRRSCHCNTLISAADVHGCPVTSLSARRRTNRPVTALK